MVLVYALGLVRTWEKMLGFETSSATQKLLLTARQPTA
jgi:hypothetical protein